MCWHLFFSVISIFSFFKQLFSFCRAHLEKTGIGQYLASSPKTWRKFLLKPRLKPFLSVPWRNTGERTASGRTHMEMTSQWMRMFPPNLQSVNSSALAQQSAHEGSLLKGCIHGTTVNWRVFAVEGGQSDLGVLLHVWLVFLGVSVTKLLTALSLMSLHYGVTHPSGLLHAGWHRQSEPLCTHNRRQTDDGARGAHLFTVLMRAVVMMMMAGGKKCNETSFIIITKVVMQTFSWLKAGRPKWGTDIWRGAWSLCTKYGYNKLQLIMHMWHHDITTHDGPEAQLNGCKLCHNEHKSWHKWCKFLTFCLRNSLYYIYRQQQSWLVW